MRSGLDRKTRSLVTAKIARVGGHTPFRVMHVTSFDTSRKPVCDFILMNNTNLYYILSRTVSQLSHSSCQIIAFDKGECLSFTHSFSVISLNLAINNYSVTN